MSQNYKILFRHLTIFIRKDFNKIPTLATAVFFIQKKSNLSIVIDYIKTDPWLKELVVVNENPDKLFDEFKSSFRNQHLAGGVVINQLNQVLLIKKRKWELPKGKIKNGEHKKEAALREVREETGLKEIRIISKLSPTYGISKNNGEYFFRKKSWYRMEAEGNQPLKPCKSEGIIDISWFDLMEASELCVDCFLG